jgi:hypothetical protein
MHIHNNDAQEIDVTDRQCHICTFDFHNKQQVCIPYKCKHIFHVECVTAYGKTVCCVCKK